MLDLSQVRQHLEGARDKLKGEIAALQAQIAHKTTRLEALGIVIEGEDSAPPAKQLQPAPTMPEESMTSRTREIVKDAKGAGVRPRDVTKKLRQRGSKPSTTFASNILFKFKQKNEVVLWDGKYYWKGFEPPQAHRN
jgi:hypothetical protein